MENALTALTGKILIILLSTSIFIPTQLTCAQTPSVWEQHDKNKPEMTLTILMEKVPAITLPQKDLASAQTHLQDGECCFSENFEYAYFRPFDCGSKIYQVSFVENDPKLSEANAEITDKPTSQKPAFIRKLSRKVSGQSPKKKKEIEIKEQDGETLTKLITYRLQKMAEAENQKNPTLRQPDKNTEVFSKITPTHEQQTVTEKPQTKINTKQKPTCEKQKDFVDLLKLIKLPVTIAAAVITAGILDLAFFYRKNVSKENQSLRSFAKFFKTSLWSCWKKPHKRFLMCLGQLALAG
ncbi:hypothetical protein KAU11_04695, partial [Candidatus Babeliales bacterium]|nr:hypothetical protein [Candidatus Babeliales bacterium]